MNLCIESKSAFVQCKPENLDALIDRLERAGYEPLLRKVAHQFANVFGGSVDDFANAKNEEDEDESGRDNEDFRRQLVNLEKLGYRWGIDNLRGFANVPEVKGD